jgi:signal peptidase I
MDDNVIKSEVADSVKADVLEVAEASAVALSETDPETSTQSSAEVEEAEAVKAKRRAGWIVRDIFDWGEILVSAVVMIVVAFTFAIRITSVDGKSMNPTLFDGDQLIVTNFFYTPKNDDIVVIYAPNLANDDGTFGKDVIKRVVGVAGDTITIGSVNDTENTGRVYRNGTPLALVDLNGITHEFVYERERETVFTEGNYLVTGGTRAAAHIEITIPYGYVFVLGDNRTNSADSRLLAYGANSAMGLVNVNHIAGRAFLRVAGSVDHWDTAFSAFGFVD